MRVALFAGMAEAVGCRHLDVAWSTGTVADLRVTLVRLRPALAPLLSRSAVAVDGRYATDDQPVVPTTDVAIIPPVSGG